MRDLKHKIVIKLVIACLVLTSLIVLSSNANVLAAAIPEGCPGSTLQGPGTYDCSKIPLGCPGSTLQGPIATPPKKCPFVAAAPTLTTSTTPNADEPPKAAPTDLGPHYCGKPEFDGFGRVKDGTAVATSIDLGCRGQGNPILDMMFAVIRLLSDGVGIVVVGSLIVGGIQYIISAGDPQAAAKAIGRIRATVFALGIYIFAYPLLNYVLPAGFFK